VDWLLLAGLGIMWAAFLIPGGHRSRSPRAGMHDHERRMELLAQAETYGTEGRWIVTPRKGMRFLGQAERTRARARERRRHVFSFLLEAIGITFLIGLVPPLREMWTATGMLVALLVAYVWLLLTIKHKAAAFRGAPDPRESTRAAMTPARRASAPSPRYVANGQSGWARPTLNGLGTVGEGDRVHVVVRTADQLARA
jgi:hypothetical protein